MTRKIKKEIPIKNYSFTPKEEAKLPQEETIRRLEEMCGKPIELFVNSLSASQLWKRYEGQVERTEAGYYFRGNDDVMDYQCKILDVLRNPDFHLIEIRSIKAKP